MSYIEKDAILVNSLDDKFRYLLWRIWDTTMPVAGFIGLNPSEGNGHDDDPTIKRMVSFAKDAGCGGLFIGNLFPFITPYPYKLKGKLDLLENNDKYLKLMKVICNPDRIFFCWGASKYAAVERVDIIKNLFPKANCFGFNKNGSPKHPVRLNAKTNMKSLDKAQLI